jgi:hypothetical protein
MNKILEENEKWAKSKAGKEAIKNITGEMFVEDTIYFNIVSAIRDSSFSGSHYIGLEKIARAIRDGIGEDLPYLIKELQKYECR